MNSALVLSIARKLKLCFTIQEKSIEAINKMKALSSSNAT